MKSGGSEILCPVGQYVTYSTALGALTCRTCTAGKFMVVSNASGNSLDCVSCATGKYASVVGAVYSVPGQSVVVLRIYNMYGTWTESNYSYSFYVTGQSAHAVVAQGSIVDFSVSQDSLLSTTLEIFSQLARVGVYTATWFDVYKRQAAFMVLGDLIAGNDIASSQVYTVKVNRQGPSTMSWDTIGVQSGLYFVAYKQNTQVKPYTMQPVLTVFVASPVPSTIVFEPKQNNEKILVAVCVGDTLIVHATTIPYITVKNQVVACQSIDVTYTQLSILVSGPAPFAWIVPEISSNMQCYIYNFPP
jgi:hypothetical protein